MNNRPEFKLSADESRTAQIRYEERIEDFLDNLCAPLVGIVPYRERHELRQEVQNHIEGLIREYLYQGKNPEVATEAALREFGEPWCVGQAFLQQWSQGTPENPPVNLIRKAAWTAFAWFGIATMLNLWLLEYCVLAAHQDVWLPVLLVSAFLSPFIAGGMVGITTPAQAERGVLIALSILTLHSCTTGLLLLPRCEGLIFCLWQLLFWLPAGRVTAYVSAACMRYVRRQRFWHVAR